MKTAADPGFFLGGGALVSCSTLTPINHIVFFGRIPVVLENCRSCQSGGGEIAHPLHPPPRSAPGREHFRMKWRSLYKLADERRVKPDTSGRVNSIWIRYVWSGHKRVQLVCVILLHEKFLQFDWLTAVVFQLNLKYLHVKITNLLRVVGINTTRDISKLSQITYNNFEISLVVFMPNITTYHAITYTNQMVTSEIRE